MHDTKSSGERWRYFLRLAIMRPSDLTGQIFVRTDLQLDVIADATAEWAEWLARRHPRAVSAGRPRRATAWISKTYSSEQPPGEGERDLSTRNGSEPVDKGIADNQRHLICAIFTFSRINTFAL
jgi:hypothetical protein